MLYYIVMIIKCCFLFLQDNSMYYYNIRYIYIFVLKCIFLVISAGGVAWGVVRLSFFFVSIWSHACTSQTCFLLQLVLF